MNIPSVSFPSRSRAGTLWPSETAWSNDAVTGVRIRQVTRYPSHHHHPYPYLPSWDEAQTFLFFVSHRTGRSEVFAELRKDSPSGRLLQITNHEGLAEWSVHPSPDGRWVYFTDGEGGWRARTDGTGEECLLRFDDAGLGVKGQKGNAQGTTSVSRCGQWWAIPVKYGPVSRLLVVATSTGRTSPILEASEIGHPEFHPDDPTWLRYAGPYHSRVWVVRRDGSNNRLAHVRRRREWIVHESWRPGTREIIAVNWPNGCIGIEVDRGTTRIVCTFNAWHPALNRSGTFLCADTVFPDRGLQIASVTDGIGMPRALCFPQASCQGPHWNTDHCPYDDEAFQQGKRSVYAPQHTHPHPTFSPDGRRIVFTSDRTGYAQVYEVEIPPEFFGDPHEEGVCH